MPTDVLTNMDFTLSETIFSLIHPKSPPLIPDFEILRFFATFSNPSIFILLFNFSISDSNLSFSTLLIKISEIKYSSTFFLL